MVRGKSPCQMRGLAAGVARPARERLFEIDIEHHAAEIEQQRISGTGGEHGAVHRGGVQKSGEARNGVTAAKQFARMLNARSPLLNTDRARSPAAGTHCRHWAGSSPSLGADKSYRAWRNW